MILKSSRTNNPFIYIILLFLSLLFFFIPSASAADIQAILDSNDGTSAFSVLDSGSVEQLHVDSDGNVVAKGCVRIDSGGAECTGTEGLVVDGSVGIGVTGPSAYIHLKAGTAAASTAPIKFTLGTS